MVTVIERQALSRHCRGLKASGVLRGGNPWLCFCSDREGLARARDGAWMPGASKGALSIGLSLPAGALGRNAACFPRPKSEARLRLKGTPASFPLPVTRRGEREPAEQPGQRLLNLAIGGGPRPLRPIQGRVHPVGRAPNADIDALLRSINAPAILAAPHDHRLSTCRQLITPAPGRGPGVSQHRTRRLLKRLVRDPQLARAGLCAGQIRDDSPEPLEANTAGRRGRRQLVVIAAADELEPALATGSLAALLLPHRPAADAARDRQATRRLHGLNISSALAVGAGQCPRSSRVLTSASRRPAQSTHDAPAGCLAGAAEPRRASAIGTQLAFVAQVNGAHKIGVPRALPVRDIPARSLAVSMAGHSQGHGNGSRQVARSRSCRWRAEGDPHDRAREVTRDAHGQRRLTPGDARQ